MELPYRFNIIDNINGNIYQIKQTMDANMKPVYAQLWILEGEIMIQIHKEEWVEENISRGHWTITDEAIG